jgi:hypothetical protein
MRDYGVVESEGTQGYGAARIGLRAPRVAVRVQSGTHWQSGFGLAIWLASGLWGGHGFIYMPHDEGGLHPALARILAAYDPDYLVDTLWTFGDAEALEPGWHARRIRDWPSDPDESEAMMAHVADRVVTGPSGDIGADWCSPFYDLPGDRSTRALWEQSGDHDLHRVATLLGGGAESAEFEVPDGLDPLLALALGMRTGYTAKPSLPLGHVVNAAERLPREYVDYVLSIGQRSSTSRLAALSTAWGQTRAGLVEIGKFRSLARPVAVFGSAAEDFALAVALDRMFGATVWIPAEWAQEPTLHWPLESALRGLVNLARSSGQVPVATTISMDDTIGAVIDACWPGSVVGIRGIDGSQPDPVGRPEVIAAANLDLQSPKHLACAGDYDLPFASPTRADGRGGLEFMLPIPVYTPRAEVLRGPTRPFWEVDVEVAPQRMVTGRNLRSEAMLPPDERDHPIVLRSGRDGISFKPMNMLFVPGGATLEQSVVRPRLRVPGLRGWIEELAAQIHPDMGIELSQAGRRAMILARLWGSRAAMAKDLLALNDFLREFRPNGASDSGAYPQGDGVRITPTEGYLTFDAAVRVLGEMKPDEIRVRLNNLLRINVLQRGLIVPCGECERRAFYRMDALREMNTCPRCGAAAYSSAARRTSFDKSEEPGWFYDLHGAVREFLEQDGDVPVLAGWALAATARAFEDIPELDFHLPGAEDPDEIDIAALVDGRVVIGEAKRIASLSTRRETNRAVQKLIRVSDLVGADEIVLATTAPGPWEDLATGQLLTATAGHRWRFGTVPRIRVLTDLRGNPQNTLLN